jgi:hypothetical protein
VNWNHSGCNEGRLADRQELLSRQVEQILRPDGDARAAGFHHLFRRMRMCLGVQEVKVKFVKEELNWAPPRI